MTTGQTTQDEGFVRGMARARWGQQAAELLGDTIGRNLHAAPQHGGKPDGLRAESLVLPQGIMLRDILQHAEAVLMHADEQPDAGREPAARIYADEFEVFLNAIGVVSCNSQSIRLSADGLWRRYFYLLAAQPCSSRFVTMQLRETDEGCSVASYSGLADGLLRKEAADA